MGNFGDVREILQRPPNLQTWEALIDALDSWYGREPLEHVLAYCQSHLNRWPAELPTFAPNSWFKRDPKTIAQSPITAFFVAAFFERTEHWRQWALQQLEAQKPLKPPGFLSLEKLGQLRWRDGAAMDENQRKRFIVYLRSFKDIAPVELERLRQLLNDEDAQRWSRLIYKAWQDNDSPSSHRWAFFQIACFGEQSLVEFDTDSMTQMISAGRHVRAKQLMEMRAALGTREAISDVANFAVFGPLSMGTRNHAVDLIKSLAKARKLSVEEYIERRLTLQDQHMPDALEHWQDPHLSWAEQAEPSPEDEEDDDDDQVDPDQPPTSLAMWLEHAMLTQRAYPWWTCRDALAQLSLQPGVLWSVDGGEAVWMSAQGPVGLAGELVELQDDALLRVTHPATLKLKLRQQWIEALAARQVAPPFVQLERPVYDKTNLVVSAQQPLVINPLTALFTTREWGAAFTSDDNIHDFSYTVRGAFWCAMATPNFVYNYEGGFFGAENEPSAIAELNIVSIFDPYNHKTKWARDAVAISEAHYALARLATLDANTTHDYDIQGS